MNKYEGHTSGPWQRSDADKWTIINSGGVIICKMQPWEVIRGRIKDNADADLVADAPKLLAERDRLRKEMARYLPILESLEEEPDAWELFSEGTGIATLNGYRAALQEDSDEK
jgi:hypothetical protein